MSDLDVRSLDLPQDRDEITFVIEREIWLVRPGYPFPLLARLSTDLERQPADF